MSAFSVARWCALALALWFGVGLNAGEALRALPPLLHTLSDEVGALAPEEAQTLSRLLAETEDQTGTKVIALIVETTMPETIDDYVERLARRWRWERDLDPEAAVFVVLAVKDREFGVLPGKKLPDLARALSQLGAMRDLSPLLRQARYFEVFQTLNSVVKELLKSSVVSLPGGTARPELRCDGLGQRRWSAQRGARRATPHIFTSGGRRARSSSHQAFSWARPKRPGASDEARRKKPGAAARLRRREFSRSRASGQDARSCAKVARPLRRSPKPAGHRRPAHR